MVRGNDDLVFKKYNTIFNKRLRDYYGGIDFNDVLFMLDTWDQFYQKHEFFVKETKQLDEFYEKAREKYNKRAIINRRKNKKRSK